MVAIIGDSAHEGGTAELLLALELLVVRTAVVDCEVDDDANF